MNYTTMELDSEVINIAELFSSLRETHIKDNNVSIGLDLSELISFITAKPTDLSLLIETSKQRTIGMANCIFTSNDEKEIMDSHLHSTIYEIAQYIAVIYKKSQGIFSFGAKSAFAEIQRNKINVITMGNGIFFEVNGEKFVSYATKTLDANKNN
jgi:hypothetical protein